MSWRLARYLRVAIPAAAIAITLIEVAWPTSALASVTVELSPEATEAFNANGGSARATTRQLQRDFNRGLEELGKTNAAAKALFESGQKLRIVCFGTKEAEDAGLRPGIGLYGGGGETKGDFNADGSPKVGGTAIIAIDCGTLRAVGMQTRTVPSDPNSTMYRILIHELLHASNAARRHPPDELAIYDQFVEAFEKALQQALGRPRDQRTSSVEPVPRSSGPGTGPVRAMPGAPLGPLVPLPQGTGGFKNSSFDAGGSFAFITVPQQSYFGAYNPMTGHEAVGLFNTNRKVTMSGGSFSFEHGLSAMFFLYGSLQAMEGSNSGSGSFEPGTGNRTLFPGPMGGASGVSLGGYPMNVITDINYRAGYSAVGGTFGFGSRFMINPNVRFSVGLHAGYQNLEVHQSMAGEVSAFARTFGYETAMSVRNYSYGVRSGIEFQALPNVILSVKGHAGGASSKGGGDDSFAFTGLPTSTAGLDVSGTQFVGGVSGGIRVTLGTLSTATSVGVAPPLGPLVVVGADFGLERLPGFPTVVRDGLFRSRMRTSSADALLITLRASIIMGGD